MSFLLLRTGRIPSLWEIYFLHQGTEESLSVLALTVFKVTFILNNQYIKVAQFGPCCSWPPHYKTLKISIS